MLHCLFDKQSVDRIQITHKWRGNECKKKPTNPNNRRMKEKEEEGEEKALLGESRVSMLSK